MELASTDPGFGRLEMDENLSGVLAWVDSRLDRLDVGCCKNWSSGYFGVVGSQDVSKAAAAAADAKAAPSPYRMSKLPPPNLLLAKKFFCPELRKELGLYRIRSAAPVSKNSAVGFSCHQDESVRLRFAMIELNGSWRHPLFGQWLITSRNWMSITKPVNSIHMTWCCPIMGGLKIFLKYWRGILLSDQRGWKSLHIQEMVVFKLFLASLFQSSRVRNETIPILPRICPNVTSRKGWQNRM